MVTFVQVLDLLSRVMLMLPKLILVYCQRHLWQQKMSRPVMKKRMKSVVMKKKMTELVVKIPFVPLKKLMQSFAFSQHWLKKIVADWK